jgi:DNA-binding NtrC family response regulator
VGKLELPQSAPKQEIRPCEPAFAPETTAKETDEPLRISLARYERDLLKAALQRHRWHRSRAARALGVDRKTLFTKLKRHKLVDT